MPEIDRTLWLSITCLGFLAIKCKDSVPTPELGLVLGILISPIWMWYFLPSLPRRAGHEVRQKIEDLPRASYGDLNISERNTARPRFCRLRLRPSSLRLSEAVQSAIHKCSLLGLPLEIRQQIWSELLRPADRIYIDYSKKRRAIVRHGQE